jgi:hypothetical protein
MTTTIDNTVDVIDSRDVIERIEELRDERDAHDEEGRGRSWAEEYPEEAEELRALEELQSEAEGYASDWRHSAQLIRDSYFEDYARGLAEDLHGDALRRTEWPFSCIDWEAAASELQQDYTAVDFDGVTYWVRS